MRKLEMNGFILLVLCMVVGLCAANFDAEDIKLTNNYMQIESKFDFEFFVNESNLNELKLTDNFQSLIHGSQSLGYEFYKEWSNIAESAERKTVRDASCFQQIAALVAGFGANELASYRYFDSWGKIPAGVLKGHITELGNFDECVDLNKKLADNSQIKGKYCFAKIPLGRALTPSPLGSLLNIDVGVCMPAACSAQEFDVFFKMLMQNLLNINFGANTKVVEEATCSVRDKEPFKARDWVAVSVLIILGVAMLISSLYDYNMKSTGKTPHPFWLSFSVPYNMKQLLVIKPNTKSPNSIPCLNGIRCLSLLWVVIGHTFSLVMTLPVINAVDFLAWGRSWGSQFIQRAFFSVDSFFFLSGFLVAFTVMREMDRTKGKLNVLMMYLHRYLRLTPTLALGVLLYTSLYRHLGNAPIWPAFRSWNDGCLNTWWSTLLYIQNYVNVERMCLPHGWYLAVDMQLYILSPIFLIALWRYRAKGVAFVSIIGLLFVACLFSTMIINDLKLHRKGFALGTGEVMKKIYFVTHVRTSPWMVGLLFGYYMHHTKNSRVKLSKLMVLVGWLATLAIIATLLFCFYPEAKDNLDTTAVQEAFYFSLGRVAWPLALSWVVFACVNGYAGPIDGFLSNPIWQPFAKLSYSIYMYHMILVAFNAARTKVNYYFSNYDETLHFWGVFGWSVILATVLYIAFEAPCANLVNLLLPKRKNTQSTAALSKEKAENIETNLEKTNKNLVEEKQHDVPTDHANNNNIEKSENVEHAENLDEIKSVPS